MGLSSIVFALLAGVVPVGEIVDPVACVAHVGQSYALYLPAGYTPERSWPVLYVLDPRGRGRLPVEIYQEAAERYGYILISSNNSLSDGDAEVNDVAMRAMLDDSSARYRLDPRRLYAAGMSGGARAACEIAARAGGGIHGLVLVGGSCAPDPRLERDRPVDFFGVVGDVDFNYLEMQQFDDRLDGLGMTHRLVTFDGPHGWHGKEVATQALEWLELRAIARGLRVEDDTFVERSYEVALARVRQIAPADPYAAWIGYREMLVTFEGLRPTAALRRETEHLAQRREVKRAIKRRRRLLRNESTRTERAERELLALLGPEPRPGAAELTRRLEIRRLVNEMRQGPGEERRLARRLLDAILVEVSFYFPEQLRRGGDLAGVALSLEVAAEIRAIVDSVPP